MFANFTDGTWHDWRYPRASLPFRNSVTSIPSRGRVLIDLVNNHGFIAKQALRQGHLAYLQGPFLRLAPSLNDMYLGFDTGVLLSPASLSPKTTSNTHTRTSEPRLGVWLRQNNTRFRHYD
jgi:hypothetical protein